MHPSRHFPALDLLIRRLVLPALLLVAASLAQAVQPIPGFAEVRAGARPSVAVLLARDGTPLAERSTKPNWDTCWMRSACAQRPNRPPTSG